MKKKLVIAIGLALIAVLSLWLYSRSLQEEVAGGQKVSQGQPLLWSDFELQKSAQSRRLAGAVQKGQRALTIAVDMSGSLAGMLRPGDHVDILGTFARAQGTDWATVTLLQNVLVVATGDLRGTGEGEEAPVGGGPRTFNNITVS